MSAVSWDWSLASADGLLTNEECYQLLDVDILETSNDLFKTLPSAAPKVEAHGLVEYAYQLQDDVSASLYPSPLSPPSPPDTKPSRSQLADDLLQQLDSQCKQENIFSPWLEEKSELAMFDSIPQLERPVLPVPVAAPVAVVPQPTEELLREFESVYGAVELTHLTPPQSPPGPATQLLLSYAHHAQQPWPQQPHQDYECDFQAVDELVRDACASPPSSPHGSSSPATSTDDEWTAPARSKPYSRGNDDRRSRKKEQNKNAATRYRQKKKAEVEVLLSEEQQLRQRHTDLDSKCSDLQREIRYLKGLMRDLFKAKGLIK